MKFIQPAGWAAPKGYSNGVLVKGQMLFIAGQIGWDTNQVFQSDNFVEQVRQALINTLTVLNTGGGNPEHIARMTWYITDRQEYLRNLRSIGTVYREIMGNHYPAMAMVEVSALIEDRAKVEIETTAVIP